MKLDDRLQAFLSHGAIAGIEVMWDFAAELQARPPADVHSRELATRYLGLLSAFHSLTAGLESGASYDTVLANVLELQTAAGALLAYAPTTTPSE